MTTSSAVLSASCTAFPNILATPPPPSNPQLYDTRVVELEAALEGAESRRLEDVSLLEGELEAARQVCACVCVCVCARACVCVCVCVGGWVWV